jgi:hypothetical protein
MNERALHRPSKLSPLLATAGLGEVVIFDSETMIRSAGIPIETDDGSPIEALVSVNSCVTPHPSHFVHVFSRLRQSLGVSPDERWLSASTDRGRTLILSLETGQQVCTSLVVGCEQGKGRLKQTSDVAPPEISDSEDPELLMRRSHTATPRLNGCIFSHAHRRCSSCVERTPRG